MTAEFNYGRLQGGVTGRMRESIRGLTVVINVDSSDQREEEKYAALRSAIELVDGKKSNVFHGFSRPLQVYFGATVKCEACWGWEKDEPGGDVSLFLGDRMMFEVNRVPPEVKPEHRRERYVYGQSGSRGVADQIYDDMRKSKDDPARWWLAVRNQYQASKASAKATAVVVHEIGHLLHEKKSRTIFWNNKRAGAPNVNPDLAEQVSSYIIGNNLDEFVAEVFTGLVYGKHYSDEVLAEYQRQGGPVFD